MKKALAGLLCLCMGLGSVPALAKEGDEALQIGFDNNLEYESYRLTYFDEGIKGKSVWFNGGTSYVKMPDDINKGVTDYTFSAWLKMTGLSKGWQRIFDFGTGTDNYVYFGIPSDTKNLRVAYKINGSDEWNFDAEGVTKLNEWMHVAVVQEGKLVKLYVDGEKVAEKECEYTLNDLGDTRSNYIGKSQFAADPRLNAYADEIKFEKRACSDAEINTMAKKPAVSYSQEDYRKALEVANGDSIKGNITLKDEVFGKSVTWKSSNEEVISTKDIPNGDYVIPKGKVTRGEEDVKVTLTATVDLGLIKPTFTQEVTVIKKCEPIGETVGYFYVYFRGFVNGSDEHLSIHIAGSEDGYNWFDLNENKPILESQMGTYELRDPYLLRSVEGDRFYLIATDLNTKDGQGWGPWSLAGSKYLMVWESEDLINWSEQRMVKFANDKIGCAWAPEAIWDPDTEEYLVYASGKDLTMENPLDTVYVVRTRDFYSFSEPEVFVAPTKEDGSRIAAIDSNIIHANDGKFYHFYKQSGHIEMMVSDHASGPYEYINEFPRPAGEGPGSFLVKGTDDTYALMVDDYSVYIPYLTTDIASGKFTKATDTITMPTGSKHGGFLPLNEEEYNRIMDKWYYISREEALERIMIKLGYGESDVQAFTDCDNGYVNKAYELGITKGNENGLFEPDRPITELECFILVSRTFGKEIDLTETEYSPYGKLTFYNFKTLLNMVATTEDGVHMNTEMEMLRAEERGNPDRIKEVKEKAITYGDVTMKYTMSIMGEEPLEGYPVYIALHGGGGSDTPDLNNSQWSAMQTYYRGSVETGIYIAPRGVRDTWDTHFNPESYYCYQRLLENLAIFYNINPDRVYLVGYSAGGDGVYQITGRMADYFASANMSAGHPNGVDLTNVKNMPLYLQCGELDTAYDRNKVTEEYGKNENVAGVFIHKNKPHNFIDNGTELQRLTDGTFQDTNAIRLVSKHVRNPYPEKIEWNLSLKKSDMFYYVESTATEGTVAVEQKGNTFIVNGDIDAIYVNNLFINVEEPIKVVYNGKEMEFEYKFDLETVRETYQKRYDKSLTFTMKINLKEN
ncbi:MAG: S-layer homology domain-containing protein [Clostridia bacterium]|nr:S-layer homology domain-containing protein [Clostridia bacterium]